MITDYHSKYIASDLTRRRSSDSSERLAVAVAGAQVDMNPHQVDAALFAFASPLSKGALLADEVGLGKTIEAGLVISQRWAEGKRRILIIAPSNIRKQWHQEMNEKFFIPCMILETKSYNAAIKSSHFRPFDCPDSVVICSYQFARNKAADVHAHPWDLVIIDEAHRLRNVYKPSNVIANTLKGALAERHKLLLTATPLQNSLLELFGLVSFIDEHAFGDLKSFREQFANLSQERTFEILRERLKPICHRTLRRQVTAYVRYTKRHAILEEFSPDEAEDRLYNLVTDYLQRDNLQALPASQRSLMTLVLRKLLASSTFAIAGALSSISNRLQLRLDKSRPSQSLVEELDEDYEALDETAEEWPDDDEDLISEADQRALESEIIELREFANLATSIEQNAKGRALLKALEVGFAKAREFGADEKAIIFTESRRTQSYLLRLLAESPFADRIVLFNGTNTDEASKAIYKDWLSRHEGSDSVTGSKTADMRSALVDYFRDTGKIMIATEAGAEGINLQFCSMVVNYDLPWNPQRIEQRIGRCHRYGQKHDVVVVNFLNRKNEADQRVYALLSEKFQLFEGVFGASDEVGAIESGVDFEKRIAGIYQQCRQTSEIRSAFDQLQKELNLEINEAMTHARRKLFENFEDEVREKLRLRNEDTNLHLNRFEQQLMKLAAHELGGDAQFLMRVARLAYEAFRKLAREPDKVPSVSYLSRPEVQEQIVREVQSQYQPAQMELERVAKPAPDIAAVIAATAKLMVERTIDIPRITIMPKEEIKAGFMQFTLDLNGMRYPAPSEELWARHMRTDQVDIIGLSQGNLRERRLEDYVVSGLIDFPDIAYDEHADMLYDLAGQVVRHLLTYLTDKDAAQVLALHQRDIARAVHAQMQDHFWRDDTVEYHHEVRQGFTELKESAYTSMQEPPLDYRVPPADKSNMARYLFGGFSKCLSTVTKFHSDSERKLAVILERESLKWMRPAKGQFQMFYRSGNDYLEYQPDFVAETFDRVFMLEPKMTTQMLDKDVLAKRDVAVQWCAWASEHARTYGGKSWKYLLIPHDVIAENMSIDFFMKQYGCK